MTGEIRTYTGTVGGREHITEVAVPTADDGRIAMHKPMLQPDVGQAEPDPEPEAS